MHYKSQFTLHQDLNNIYHKIGIDTLLMGTNDWILLICILVICIETLVIGTQTLVIRVIGIKTLVIFTQTPISIEALDIGTLSLFNDTLTFVIRDTLSFVIHTVHPRYRFETLVIG